MEGFFILFLVLGLSHNLFEFLLYLVNRLIEFMNLKGFKVLFLIGLLKFSV